MISKRTWLLGTLALVVCGMLASDLLAKPVNCGRAGQAISNAVLIHRERRHGPCSDLGAASGFGQLWFGLLFFGVFATVVSLSVDVRAWRNAGMDG